MVESQNQFTLSHWESRDGRTERIYVNGAIEGYFERTYQTRALDATNRYERHRLVKGEDARGEWSGMTWVGEKGADFAILRALSITVEAGTEIARSPKLCDGHGNPLFQVLYDGCRNRACWRGPTKLPESSATVRAVRAQVWTLDEEDAREDTR